MSIVCPGGAAWGAVEPIEGICASARRAATATKHKIPVAVNPCRVNFRIASFSISAGQADECSAWWRRTQAGVLPATGNDFSGGTYLPTQSAWAAPDQQS